MALTNQPEVRSLEVRGGQRRGPKQRVVSLLDYVPRSAFTPQIMFLISTLLYFFPYLVGEFDYITHSGARYKMPYHSATGWVVVAALTCILIAIALIRPKKQELRTAPDSAESLVLMGLMISAGAYTLATPELFQASKYAVLESTNRFHFIFYNTCIIGVISSFIMGWRSSKYLLLISIIGLSIVLFIGHRSTTAIAIIGVLYVLFRNISLSFIKLKYVAWALGMLMFLAVYKSVYVLVKMGQFGAAIKKISSLGFVDSAKIGMEQFIIFAHLDFVVTYDFRLACSNIPLMPLSIIPFMDNVINFNKCGYNAQVQPVFFNGYSGGVAANIWAEFFANFGYLGIPLVVLSVLALCALFERAISSVRSPVLKAGLIVGIVNLAFYIQRKELLGAFISAKRAVIVALIVVIGAYLVRRFAFKLQPLQR